MKRTSLEGNVCPVARSLDVIGDWWSLLIVRDALGGTRRFGEFQRGLGIAKNILAARLKSLVANGILEVVEASDGGARAEYVPTEKGRALVPVLVALGQWGSEHLFSPGETCSVLVDAATKRPLERVVVRANDGRELASHEVSYRRATTPARSKRNRAR